MQCNLDNKKNKSQLPSKPSVKTHPACAAHLTTSPQQHILNSLATAAAERKMSSRKRVQAHCRTPLPRSSPFTTEPTAASLVQSARRRLQYSQLPVRCGAGPNRRLASSLRKFAQHQQTPKRVGSNEDALQQGYLTDRRSLSMGDLAFQTVGAQGLGSAELR